MVDEIGIANADRIEHRQRASARLGLGRAVMQR